MKVMIGVLAVVALAVAGTIYAMRENNTVPQTAAGTSAASIPAAQDAFAQEALSALEGKANVAEETEIAVISGQNEEDIVVRNTIVATPAAPRVQNTVSQNRQAQAQAAAKAKAAQEAAAKKAAQAAAIAKAAEEEAAAKAKAAQEAAEAEAANKEVAAAKAKALAAQQAAQAKAQAAAEAAQAAQVAADNAFAAFESAFVSPEAFNNISGAAEQAAQDVEETLSPSVP